MKNKKSEDCYSVSPFIVKNCFLHIIEPLADVINACILEGCFPARLKVAKVVPVFKKGDTNDPSNYRPISILPTFSKILEMVLCQSLVSFFELHRIFTPSQFGFRRDLSTTGAIYKLWDFVRESMEAGDACGCLFTDLTSAFDSVDHNLLLSKLEHYGVRGRSLEIFKSYLEERYQRVYVLNEVSSTLPIKRGVPQGSILGPILFLVYVNDLPGAISVDQAVTLQYADDTSFCVRCSKDLPLKPVFQAVLERAKLWFTTNKLFLNDEKTTELSFQSRAGGDSSGHKFLGVLFDTSLGWREQIESLNGRLSSSLYALRKIRYTVGQQASLTAYHALFHSKMSYGIIAWGNAADTHLKTVFLKQKRAVRIIANISTMETCRPYFVLFNIVTLYGQIIYENLCHVRSHCGEYQTHNDIHSHNTRFKNNIVKPTSRLHKFGCIGIDFLNLLPVGVRELQLNIFKRRIKRYLVNLAPYSFDEFKTALRESRNFNILIP